MSGYIYIRNHASYAEYDACKMGKTNNIPDRDSQYVTGEIIRGYFELIIDVLYEYMDQIEKDLQEYFKQYHIQFDGGTEFYKKDIIYHIIPYLETSIYTFRVLSKDEINDLTRTIRDKHITPRLDQSTIIDISINFFKQNNKGILILPCGTGKTVISLLIAHKMACNTILIGVPNKLLLYQWKEIFTIIFKDMPYLIVSGGVNIEDIDKFMSIHKRYIIITTYSSSYKVLCTAHHSFDIKINDECHHILNEDEINEDTHKRFTQILKIKSHKQLSLTATLKVLDIERDPEPIIYKKCLLSAINDNIICDYVIQTIITDSIIDDILYLSAYVALKSIFNNHSHHILIYCNNTENSLKISNYIRDILMEFLTDHNIYHSNYHSDMNIYHQKDILSEFNKSKFGIISCVYCLSEGYDNPIIDAVVFAENMSSNIRIVQSALRASRKNKNEPNKIMKIILPVLNKDNWLDNDNPDFKKVRQVIYEMGLEDETIIQKIKVSKISLSSGSISKISDTGTYTEIESEDLLLKTVRRVALNISYSTACNIIAGKNIKSKAEYYDLCDKDYRLSKEPDVVYKSKFTNWIEYLNIERVYYDLAECKQKVNEEYSFESIFEYSEIIKKLKETDDKFPPYDLWCDYYSIYNLSEIFTNNIDDNPLDL